MEHYDSKNAEKVEKIIKFQKIIMRKLGNNKKLFNKYWREAYNSLDHAHYVYGYLDILAVMFEQVKKYRPRKKKKTEEQ